MQTLWNVFKTDCGTQNYTHSGKHHSTCENVHTFIYRHQFRPPFINPYHETCHSQLPGRKLAHSKRKIIMGQPHRNASAMYEMLGRQERAGKKTKR